MSPEIAVDASTIFKKAHTAGIAIKYSIHNIDSQNDRLCHAASSIYFEALVMKLHGVVGYALNLNCINRNMSIFLLNSQGLSVTAIKNKCAL